MKRVLVLGLNGQLGRELSGTKPPEIILCSDKINIIDISNTEQVCDGISVLKPDVIINAAAYTAVDQAERERERACQVNETGPSNIAKVCCSVGCRLIHVSTDFVFDGTSCRPYLPDAPANPLNVYGESKYHGEKAVLREMKEGALIFRTAWLYSTHGNNFVVTMLERMKTSKQLEIVHDQTGSPTWARNLAKMIWRAVQLYPKVSGIYHYTDAGVASWYDFAVAIQKEALEFKILKKAIPLIPISSHQYPTVAKRPAYSVLDCSLTRREFSVAPVHWKLCLREMLKETSQIKCA